MTSTDVVLAVVALNATGFAVYLAIRLVRLRAYCYRQDRLTTSLHRRADQAREEAEAALEEIRELAPVIADGQRRWGCRLGPRAAAAVAQVSPEAGSWWLLTHAPGIGGLSEGRRATATFYAPPAEEFTGWTPPQALAPPAPRRRARRPRVALAAPQPERGDR